MFIKANKTIKNILVVALSNLGDVILSLPILSAFKNKYSANIDLLAGEKVKAFLSDIPSLATVYDYNKKSSLFSKLRLISELRNNKYDFVLDFRNSIIPYIIGVPSKSLLLNNSIRKIESRYQRCEYLLELLDLQHYSTPILKLYSKDDENFILAKLRTKGIFNLNNMLIVAPGARYKFKRWPASYFTCLIKKILLKQQMQVVLVGDTFEKDICCELDAGLIGVNVIDLCGVISVNQLSFLVQRAQLVLSNDSALMHLANYYKRAVLAIFGPTSPLKYGLTSPTSRVVSPPKEFTLNKNFSDEDKLNSLKYVTPEMAFPLVMELLDAKND